MPLPGPEWDPRQSEYLISEFGTDSAVVLGALIALNAFVLCRFGAFFTYPAAAAPIPTLGVRTVVTFTGGGVNVGTTTFVNGGSTLSNAQMIALAEMQAGGAYGLAFSEGAVAAILESWGFTAFSLEGLLALSLWERTIIPGYHSNFGYAMGHQLGGGSTTPPGWPGFALGGPQGVSPGGGYYGCVYVGTPPEIVCFWTY